MGALALVAEHKMTFGDWLKKVRTEKGLTQKQLADAAGCKVQYISRIENNADIGKDGAPSKPNVAFVDIWADLLEVPINEARRIAGHREQISSQEEEDRTILDYLRDASEPSREIMRAVLKTIYEVDKRRVAEGSESSQQVAEDPQERTAGKWPGAETADTKGSKKSSKRR